MGAWNKRIGETRWLQIGLGMLAASYLKLVWRTTRVTFEPPDLYERIAPELPVIVAMWHGQHFMMPFLKRAEHRVKVLISRHRDGEINAIVSERLGVGAIRGSGDPGGRHDRKGGAGAFRAMQLALDEGYNMALTADVPKIARVCGRGIIKLGQATGRTIYPVALATSRRIELANWDRSAVNLPFGRGAIVAGGPVRIPADADAEMLESLRSELERDLNRVTARAYAIVDRVDQDRGRG